MAEHVLDPGDHASITADLLRTGFHAAVDRGDATALIRLHGELDLATAPKLSEAVATVLDPRPRSLALDLRELTFVDSTGLNVLVAAHRRAQADGCAFVVLARRGAVLRAIQVTGMDRLFEVEVDETSV